MTELWMWGLIASLILLAIGTSLKSAHDAFLLKQSDKEVTRLSSSIEALKKEHHETISGISESNSTEIKKLSQKIDKSPEKNLSQSLEKVKENILQVLAAHPNMTAEQLARGMEVNAQIITFHLTELEKNKFIHGSYSFMDETDWSIAHDGRAYLIHHGLLS